MNAETLNCPMCGAATSTDDPLCKYCGSRLATIACASCFGMMFVGSKHCPRCGAAATIPKTGDLAERKCPHCRQPMRSVVIGTTSVEECESCLGLWVNVSSFEKICADREQQAAVLGGASPAPREPITETVKVRYFRCPQCGQLMNRINFARCSGVIVDICRGHGTWFDRDELSRIIEFIRAGGLDLARAKEKAQIEEARRQLNQQQFSPDHPSILERDEFKSLLKILLG
jgi:Zn-finger nucleic acid-binding protein